MNAPYENPEVRRIIDEVTALNLTLRALQEPSSAKEALRLVRRMWDNRSPARTLEAFFIQAAWARILSEDPPPKPTLSRSPRIPTLLGFAWVAWAQEDSQEARRILRDLTFKAPLGVDPHHETLLLWRDAIWALTSRQNDIAACRFQQAYEIGASFGSESHPIILWTMAASFFKPSPIC